MEILKRKKQEGNIGIFGLLGILFVTLKLCSVITWSWWLVLLPFYGGLALVLLIGAFIVALD